MKLKKSTLGLILLAASLAGFVYFYEIRAQEKLAEIEEREKLVFEFSGDRVESISITTAEENLTIEKQTVEDSEKVTWQITSPEQKDAHNPTVEFLLGKFATLKSDRSIPTSTSQLSEYGLDKPGVILEIELTDDEVYRLNFGQSDFSDSFVYAFLESPETSGEEVSVLLLPETFLNVITKPVSEWESKESDEEVVEEESGGDSPEEVVEEESGGDSPESSDDLPESSE